MASNRPAWFRLSSMRPTALPLGPPPAPAPALVRPAFPVRPPPPPTQTQQPAPPPSLPPTAPPSPQGPAVTAPPSPPAAPPMFPVAPPAPLAAPPPTSPTMLPPPPQASPPRARSATPAPKSPTPAPPASPMTKSSPTTSIKFLRPSSSSLPTSPSTSKITSPVAPTEPVNVKAATPVSSPKIVKFSENSPLQSPKLKPQSHPPSPLKLPPPQIIEPKIEEKDVLVQDKPMKIHNNPHNHANATIGKRQQPPMKDKKLSNSEESGTRMITIAGDNKGAVMEITPSHRRTAGAHSLHNNEKSEKETTVQTQAKTTYLNSNVQGVNNSIVFNSDSHHNDPGIHLCVVRKVNGGRYKD